MSDIAALVANNLDIWTSATQRKSGARRGGGGRISLYGISRLRALILDLSVRGKLVPQDARDEPASELLKRIAKAKAEMIRDGIIRKPRDTDGKAMLKPPFSIPESWRWVTLDQIGAIVGGGTPSSNDAACLTEGGTGIAWLTPADLGGFSGRYIEHGARDLTEYGLKTSSATLMPKGTVLFTSRAPIGYVAIAKNPITTNQGFKSIVPYVSDTSLFIATALKSFAKRINDSAPGTTFKEVSGKIVAAVPFPLPSLAEQRRIVAKVDELMALCDALERESADTMAAHQTLVEELLGTLVNSESAAELAANWARLEAHFDTLFTTDASLEALKQTILDLAMRGKLVSQHVDDEPAQMLLQKLKSEKQALILNNRGGSGKSRQQPWTDVEFFPIPPNWIWTCLGELTETITSGSRDWSKYLSSHGAKFVTMGNLSRGSYDLRLEKMHYVQIGDDREGTRTSLQAGDLLVSITGDVGNMALIPEGFGEAYINQHTAMLRFLPSVRGRFFAELLRSPLAQKQFNEPQRGVKNSFRLSDIQNIKIPVPPLSEQHRIVAKVDALMALCDALKARLAEAEKTRCHLADAITERATA